MERDNHVPTAYYHFVGREDAAFFKNINPDAKAIFFYHPLYEYRKKDNIGFKRNNIKVLIAGRNDIYMKEATDDLIRELCKNNERTRIIKAQMTFTFLGKGWEQCVSKLKQNGYKVQLTIFAANYIEELQYHDLQITPISVGTGTKGKVLDAIANGLLEIGTHGALENITVENEQSCIEYDDTDYCITKLADICEHPNRYRNMAIQGTNAVIVNHDRKEVAISVFGLFD
jgi:hypothetical protein